MAAPTTPPSTPPSVRAPSEAMDDPAAFFDAVGDPAKLQANLATMMDSCGRFIDFTRIDIIPTSQYDC